MFVFDDEYLEFYEDFLRIFGGSEVVLFVYEDLEIFDFGGDGFVCVDVFGSCVVKVEGVVEVLSLVMVDWFL